MEQINKQGIEALTLMIEKYKNGGDLKKNSGIHIDPENEGKFTKAAKNAGQGVQEHANKVVSNPDNYTELQRKRAQFAINAKKFKH